MWDLQVTEVIGPFTIELLVTTGYRSKFVCNYVLPMYLKYKGMWNLQVTEVNNIGLFTIELQVTTGYIIIVKGEDCKTSYQAIQIDNCLEIVCENTV